VLALGVPLKQLAALVTTMPQPFVAWITEQQHRHGHEHPGVRYEVTHSISRVRKDAACVRPSQRENVDLDHLRDVLQEFT
jgi:hypothetical protein